MSPSRKQLEAWLRTIEVRGEVIDIGGLFKPIKGRTKTWEVSDYEILDIKPYRSGVRADIVMDLNYEDFTFDPAEFDVAFCIEVFSHLWNPFVALHNIHLLLKEKGLLYLSTHFLFPNHSGNDSLRYTRYGITKLLTESGFEVLEIIPKKPTRDLSEWLNSESAVVKYPNEIGHLVKARKI